MTFTVTVPDELATRLIALPQGERDSEVAAALALKWEAEDDQRLAEEVAIERGIAEFEAGRTMSHAAFTAKWDEFRAQATAR